MLPLLNLYYLFFLFFFTLSIILIAICFLCIFFMTILHNNFREAAPAKNLVSIQDIEEAFNIMGFKLPPMLQQQAIGNYIWLLSILP